MPWLDEVEGAQSVRAVFRDVVPTLDAVRLHELTLHQDGPTLVLRIDLSEYPSAPPDKWVKAGGNTVQLKLTLDGVSSMEIVGWTRNNVGAVDLRRAGPKGIELEFRASGCLLKAMCDLVRVDHIGAYHDAAR